LLLVGTGTAYGLRGPLPDARPGGHVPTSVRSVLLMSDLVFIVLTVVVFAALGLIAKGVERL
jgi:hypothetical protein